MIIPVKIYSITAHDNESNKTYIYIGSTTRQLNQRHSAHKSDYRRWQADKTVKCLTKSIAVFDKGETTITELSKVDKSDRYEKEYEYIEIFAKDPKYVVVNEIRPKPEGAEERRKARESRKRLLQKWDEIDRRKMQSLREFYAENNNN